MKVLQDVDFCEISERFESGEIKMWPPPPAMILISVVQVICFKFQAGDVGFWSYR